MSVAGLTPADNDAITDIITSTYADTSVEPESGVLVATGYGITVNVSNDNLTITDGYAPNKRTRTINRHNRAVNRLIIIGTTGSISLAALQWCTETHTTLAHVDRFGKLISTTTTDTYYDARIKRAQAAAFGTPVGLDMARQLITAKLTGHRAVMADILGCSPREIATMNGHLERLETAPDLDTVRKVESTAAFYYFGRWGPRVRPRWAAADYQRVPEHWRTFPYRQSLIGKKGPMNAIDPINATLNYGYALGEMECVHACHRLGLDPQLGILHTDNTNRNSMALDLLEAIRPQIEARVIDFFHTRVFRKVDFLAETSGSCRLTETVTHHLTDQLPEWRAALAPLAEAVTNAIITDIAPGALKPRTPLTGARMRTGSAAGRTRNPMRPISEAVPDLSEIDLD